MIGKGNLPILTEEEGDILIASLVESRGGGRFSEREAELLLTWAAKVKIDMAFLNLVYQGKARVDMVRGEIVFRDKES